jgi:hypothetical protein
MRDNRYDDPYRSRASYERAVLRPDWGRPHPGDPNWADGHYHGMRSAGGPWQAPYGRYRHAHEADRGGWGGYEGRYARPPGGFGPDGLLGMDGRRSEDREPRRPWRYDEDFRDAGPGWQGGGVRGDAEYLRQYNSRSPGLDRGGPPRRGYSHAEGYAAGARYPDEGRTRERAYGGYNQGGWAGGTRPGPGTRAARPNR